VTITVLTTPVSIDTTGFTDNAFNTRDVSGDHAAFAGADWCIIEAVNDTSSNNVMVRSSDSTDDRSTHDVDNGSRCHMFRHVGTSANDDSIDFLGFNYTNVTFFLIAYGTDDNVKGRANGLAMDETIDVWDATAISALGGASIAGGFVDITGAGSNDTTSIRPGDSTFDDARVVNQNAGSFHVGVDTGDDTIDFITNDTTNKSAYDHGHTTNDGADGTWTYHSTVINRIGDLSSTNTYEEITAPAATATIGTYVCSDDAGTFVSLIVNGDGVYEPTNDLNCQKANRPLPMVALHTDGTAHARANVITGGAALYEWGYFIPAAGGANPKGPLGMPLEGPLAGPI